MPSSETQFKPGEVSGPSIDGRRNNGRKSFLSEPENLKLVAELFAAGATREKMCEECGVSDPATITRWRKDPRVKAAVRKILNDRIMRISSRTDAVIEQRLQSASEMTIDDLIKIRKEFGGSALVRESIDEDSMLTEAMDALEDNPELLDQMRELLRKAAANQPLVVPDTPAELQE